MRVRFWGTRGSIAAPLTNRDLERKLLRVLGAYREAGCPAELETFLGGLPFAATHTFGGNTCCVQVDPGGAESVILDAGSGLRQLGDELVARGPGQVMHVVFSHFHWDHIQGLPFFKPAYVPGNTIHFHAVQAGFEEILRGQQDGAYFPVDMDYMQAQFVFHQMPAERPVTIAGCDILAYPNHHPDEAYGIVVSHAGRKVVYASDCEYVDMEPELIERFIARFRGADLLIFDAQYTLEEVVGSKYQWGHSTYSVGLDFARLAEVKRLAFFHHDPANSDDRLHELWESARHYRELTFLPGMDCELYWAYDGFELRL